MRIIGGLRLKGEWSRLKNRGVSFIVFHNGPMGGQTGKEHEYTGSLFAGLEAEEPKEVQFDNCLVLAQPEYRDTGRIQEWVCHVHAQRSIFQQETNLEMSATASNRIAVQSKRKNLKPGDRVVLTGILRDDTVLFPTGETKTIPHLALTQAPQMVVKEKRVSTTVYEQQRKTR